MNRFFVSSEFLRFLGLMLICVNLHIKDSLAQATTRTNLGLYGCSVNGLAVTDDVTLTAVACEGPKGIYLSSDFGSTWSYAAGGVYTSGAAAAIEITGNGIYALSSNKLIQTPLADAKQLSPSWSEIPLPDNSGTFIPSGGFTKVNSLLLFSWRLGVSQGAVAVLDTATNQYPILKTLPTGRIAHSIAVVSDKIYVVAYTGTFFIADQTKLYRADFNSSSGSIGEFVDITSSLPSLVDGVTTVYPSTVASVGEGKLMATVSSTGATKQAFISTNGGAFTQVLPVDQNNNLTPNMTYYSPDRTDNLAKGCFKGNSIILNSYLSRDGGSSWIKFKSTINDEYNLFNGDQCIFDPTDGSANTVLVKTVDGLIRSKDLQDTAPTWTPAISGMESITVQDMAQVKRGEIDTVALVTNAGLAFTQNFSSTDRKWSFPRCNSRKSCWSYSIALDPNNPDLVFSGTEDIEMGRLSTNEAGEITASWRLLLDNPSGATDGDDRAADLKFKIFKDIPNRIFGLYSWSYSDMADGSNGGLFSVTYASDPNDTTTTTHPAVLAGKPIKDLIAINSSLLFASVPPNPTVTQAGIYKLTLSQSGSISAEYIDPEMVPTAGGHSLFAYDKSRDILYAAAKNSLFVLENAANSGTAWISRSYGDSSGNMAISIDENQNRIFRSENNIIYSSDDSGASWSTYYTGLTDERFYLLAPDLSEPSTAPLIRELGSKRFIALSTSSLVTGSATGLNKLTDQAINTPISAPDPGARTPSSCSLTVGKSCRGRSVRKGASCKLTSGLKNLSSQNGIAGHNLSLQRRIGSGQWTSIRTSSTDKNGRRELIVKVKSSATYRVVYESASVSCTTAGRTIKVAGKKR